MEHLFVTEEINKLIKKRGFKDRIIEIYFCPGDLNYKRNQTGAPLWQQAIDYINKGDTIVHQNNKGEWCVSVEGDTKVYQSREQAVKEALLVF